MRLGIGIDRATDFGHPQLHAPMGELRKDVLHLTGRAEGSLGFTNDDAGPAAIRVGELGNEGGRFGASVPGDRTRDVGVVNDRNNLGASDYEGVGPGKLPAQTLARVLLVVGGRPGVRGKRNERSCLGHAARLGCSACRASVARTSCARAMAKSVVMTGGAVASKEISPSSPIGSDLMSRSVLSEDTPAPCLRSVTVGRCRHDAVDSLS